MSDSKKTIANKIIRNTKIFHTSKELADAIDNVFTDYNVMTKHQLNQALGITKQNVYEWKESKTDEVKVMHNYIMQAYNFIESNLVEGAVQGTFNSYIVKFILNSQFQWRENAPINQEQSIKVINLENKSKIDLGK